MNPQGPSLRDIHLPADPSWWPPAPGWWLLALVATGLLLFAARVLLRRWRKRRWRRLVLAELERIAEQQASTPDSVRLAADVSQLLRRASRLVDAGAASLRGEAWVTFLDSVLAGEDFSRGVGRCLLDGPFRRTLSVDSDGLLALTRAWLEKALAGSAQHG
ncbi:MAG TPA: DUF4381 domain-containing protein [Dokdonella sp.]|nr:DUF4381 domain-containing protein [Dokdonella sp.]